MNDVKLTDFSSNELQTLLVEVVAACEREAFDSFGEFSNKYDSLSMWRAQIVAAIGQVRMKEINTMEN